jgi:hypothetical protein
VIAGRERIRLMKGNHRGKVESKEIFYAELEEFARE